MKKLFIDVRLALTLLGDDRKTKFLRLVILRTAIGTFDLIGILLLGLVANEITSSENSVSVADRAVSFIGLTSASNFQVITSLSGLSLLFFCLKGILSTLINLKIFRLLGSAELDIGVRALIDNVNRSTNRELLVSSQVISFDLSSGVLAAITRLLGYGAIVVGEAVAVIPVAIALTIIDPVTALVALLFFSSIGLILHFIISKRSAMFGTLLATSTTQTMVVVQESLGLSREIRLARKEDAAALRYRRAKMEATMSNATLLTLGTVPRHIVDTSLVLGVGLMAIVQFGLKSQTEAIASLGLFLIAGVRLTPTFLAAQAALSAMSQAASEGAGVLSRLDTKSTFQSREFAPSSAVAEDEEPFNIELNNVSFEVNENRILENVSFTIPFGAFVGVIGPSGAGKSTLIDLLLGVPPTAGSVTIKGLSPRQIQQLHLGVIAYVPQSAIVLETSIAGNIALDDNNFDAQHVAECLARVGLEDFLLSLPDGIDTKIGPISRPLSGGESQRLSIARALYLDPKILILDEPTSALDKSSESVIISLIETLAGERTVIAIAHRLSTIKNADLIVSMEQGQILSVGSWQEILTTED